MRSVLYLSRYVKKAYLILISDRHLRLAMCPDIKLSWFYKHYDASSVEAIRQMIVARFQISYNPSGDSRISCSQSPEPAPKVCTNLHNHNDVGALIYLSNLASKPVAPGSLFCIQWRCKSSSTLLYGSRLYRSLPGIKC
jgi:hypothetical protein